MSKLHPGDAGQYSCLKGAQNSSVCIVCGAGTYSDTPGSSLCTGCIAGKFSSAEAASSSVICTQCNAGQYASIEGANSSSVCMECNAGTYSALPGLSSCIDCPSAQTSVAFGANDSAQCTKCWSSSSDVSAQLSSIHCQKRSFQAGVWPTQSELGDAAYCVPCTSEQNRSQELLNSVSLNTPEKLARFFSMLMRIMRTTNAEAAVQFVLDYDVKKFRRPVTSAQAKITSKPSIKGRRKVQQRRLLTTSALPSSNSQNKSSLVSSFCGANTSA